MFLRTLVSPLFSWIKLTCSFVGLVQNLIQKQKHIEAVRFICAYNMANKNQSIDLLWKHVESAKVISDSNCKKTNHIETKVCFSYSYSFLFYETFHTFMLVINKLNVNSV
ncbi:unnamed protein product [Trifolium pratense]|uniref:Uncharacterized protein n=1 Tax=Trifolium pratense TaxID=57577 RepID=A0ACB0LW73_TRIPR|nr:unnamed protein product [Trifolium pratense]